MLCYYRRQGLGGLHVFCPDHTVSYLAIKEHKYRCPDPLLRGPTLLLIKVWTQSVGTNCIFLKKRKTCIIYHF